MRQLLYQSLVDNVAMQELCTGDAGRADRVRVYQWGSLGVGDIPEHPAFPFFVIFENPSTVFQEVREIKAQNRYFQVYGYDEHGLGYLQIERGLRIVRDTVLGLEMQMSPSGARCIDARWTGMGVDSRDPDYNANMKFINVVLTASQ